MFYFLEQQFYSPPLFIQKCNFFCRTLHAVAFTANGDGFNETFKPIITGISQYKMTISNRWGEILFTSTDPEDAWDGKYNDEECSLGVYFVVFDYKRCNSKKKWGGAPKLLQVVLLYFGRHNRYF